MVRTGRAKRMVAIGMLAGVLLSGCSYGSSNLSSSFAPPVEDETTQEETTAQHLEKQLIAVLNLGRDDKVTSDTALGQAASFFLEYVLQDPQTYVKAEQPVSLDGMLDNRNAIAFVYDGALSSVQAGEAFLSDLEEVGFGTSVELKYQSLNQISVAYGEGEEGSVWLILGHYTAEESKADSDHALEEGTEQSSSSASEQNG